MPVEPSFIAKASIAAWKRSGSIRFTSPLASQALICAGMCLQNITWYLAIRPPPQPGGQAAGRGLVVGQVLEGGGTGRHLLAVRAAPADGAVLAAHRLQRTGRAAIAVDRAPPPVTRAQLGESTCDCRDNPLWIEVL